MTRPGTHFGYQIHPSRWLDDGWTDDRPIPPGARRRPRATASVVPRGGGRGSANAGGDRGPRG